MTKVLRLCLVTVCAILLPSACGKPAQSGGVNATAASTNSSVAHHDLSVDESRGGHTLQRHVGKSDAELRERLSRERHISAASTYTDRSTAEQVVAAALQENRDKVMRWATSSGGHPNLVLDYRSPEPIGKSMNRRDLTSRSCSQALVVLRWTPNGYYVLTSYPECR